MGFDRHLFRPPRPRLGQRAVLERRRAVHHDEAVDRHLEHPMRLARLPDEIRQVELVARVPDHADGGVAEDQPRAARGGREGARADAGGGRAGRTRRTAPAPTARSAIRKPRRATRPRSNATSTASRLDGAAGDRLDARDHGQADQLRQREPETCGRHQRYDDSENEPTAQAHRYNPMLQVCHRDAHSLRRPTTLSRDGQVRKDRKAARPPLADPVLHWARSTGSRWVSPATACRHRVRKAPWSAAPFTAATSRGKSARLIDGRRGPATRARARPRASGSARAPAGRRAGAPQR